MSRQLLRFLAAGITAVAIDFASYWLLMAAGMAVAPAKALGFLTGAAFAYIANRDWTFRAQGSAAVLLRFTLLYLFSLGGNVAVNEVALAILPIGENARVAAFFLATLVSATINFLGMKFLVFRAPAESAVP